MRHLLGAPSAILGFCIYALAGQGSAVASPLGLTLDLVAPATPCVGNQCPVDISLPFIGANPLGSTAFTYGLGQGSPANYVAAVTLDNTVTRPIVCAEISGAGTPGPVAVARFALSYNNPAASGGLLEFGAGGPSIVDLSSLIYDAGGSPSTTALTYANSAAAQVLCYPINPIGVSNPFLPAGSVSGDRIFLSKFEDPNAHVLGEPWVSVQTINSPSSGTQQSKPAGPLMATPANDMVYVVQIHHAVAGWHLDFGYDNAYFDPGNNGGGGAIQWCVLTSPQPGVPTSCGASGAVNTAPIHVLAAGDIQTDGSAYIQVSMAGSATATTNWAAQTTANYPAVAAIFPPAGAYPQRLDDKVAVASANNLPVQNVGSIVCANAIPTTCTVKDADGNLIAQPSSGNLTAGQLNFGYTVSGDTVSIDPVAYLVDPTSGSTLPGAPALTGSNFNCSASSALSSTIPPTLSPAGGTLGFTFVQSGGVYVPGTTTCTATFTTGSTPFALSNTQTFTITMSPTTATHFSVTAPSTAAAGTSLSNAITVIAEDSGNNTVANYSGTVHFTSTDAQADLPANATLTNGVGAFSATLKTAANQTITATDTVNASLNGISGSIVVSPAPAASFVVQALSPQTHGQQFQISVTAEDAYGNTATGYTGSVQFTSTTDANAVLPANQILISGVASPLPYVTLNTTGPQTVTATDTVTLSITGVSNSITVN